MGKTSVSTVLVSTLLSIVAGGAAAWFVTEWQSMKDRQKEPAASVLDKEDEPARLTRAESSGMVDFCDAAESCVKGVVYVKVTQRAKQRSSSVLDLLFGYARTPQEQVGMGSGVIISENGYIVTNNHVVENADVIEVTTYDNQVYAAKLVGTDVATDVALIKIDASNLPVIPFGDSDELRLGEWVLAIGSPYDLRSTITAGIVSAKGRSLPNYDGQFKVESFVQTDAAVNPGNSGGALVNAAGELVGINTSIISLTGSYSGYSFAVPVNIVHKIAEDFINFGEVRRAMLGLTMTPVEEKLRVHYGLESNDGVMVVEVQQGGAADNAGIKAGDVIVEIDMKKVTGTSTVQELVGVHSPGEEMLVTIVRDKQRKDIVVHL